MAGIYRQVAALHSDHNRQVPQYIYIYILGTLGLERTVLIFDVS